MVCGKPTAVPEWVAGNPAGQEAKGIAEESCYFKKKGGK